MHLIHELQDKYEITPDWTDIVYIGITLNWGYKAGILDISIPVYVKEALHKFHRPTTIQPQHFPHQCNPHNYGSTEPQLEHQAPESPKLAPSEANTVQQVVGTFLYYVGAVDPTIIVALNRITTEQANSTEATAKSFTQVLNYAATHPESITRYHASGIILHIHSDASFLSEPGAKSRAG